MTSARQPEPPVALAAAAGSSRGRWAQALRALPASLSPLPLHPASQLVHLQPAPASGPAEPWRMLELLDAPGDPPLFDRVGEALAVAHHNLRDRAAWLREMSGASPATPAPSYNLIYVHPGCDNRAEIRALFATLENALAPEGLIWLQAIDPIFAPASLPPAGRTLPALSALLAELAPARWQITLRCQRGIFAPEWLIHRATPQAQARWQVAREQFARGFPHQPFTAAAWCGLPATAQAPAAGVAAPATPPAPTAVADLTLRDGLDLPRRDPTGRFFRPVFAPAQRVVVTARIPAPDAAAHPSRWAHLRVTVDANPAAGPLKLAWLGAPSLPHSDLETISPDLPPGRHLQSWTVAVPPDTGLAHLLLTAEGLTHLYHLHIERLPAPATTTPPDLARLPRDLHARHQAAASVFSTTPAPSTLLDIGGAPGLLATLLPQHHVTLVDTAHAAEHPNFLRLPALAHVASSAPAPVSASGAALSAAPTPTASAAAFRLPFPDHAFDAVVAIDVLEHIPPAHRAAFIAEAARVARATLLIACPVDSPAARAAETALAKHWAAQQTAAENSTHEFLEEHRLYGLPTTAEIEAWFAAAQRPVTQTEAGATVTQWFNDTAADLNLPPKALSAELASTNPTADATPYRRQFRWAAALTTG